MLLLLLHGMRAMSSRRSGLLLREVVGLLVVLGQGVRAHHAAAARLGLWQPRARGTW